jgi:hypothetical protein
VIIWVGAIFANLENQSTTMKMASTPFHSGSWVMKSMETHFYSSFKIGKGLYSPYFFLYMTFIFRHLTQVHTKWFTSCFILSQ